MTTFQPLTPPRLQDGDRRRLELLEGQLEAAPEGVLLVEPGGRILSFNRRFAELWRIPDEVLATGSDEAALAYVLDQLEDPTGFAARVQYLYDHPDEVARDEVRLADGRVFDRYCAPVRAADGELIGRVWFFRDVSDEKEIEARAIEGSRRLAFLAETSLEVSSSLDYRQILGRIVRLSVPFLADWCFVDMVERAGSIHRVALAHDEPDREWLAEQLRHPRPDPGSTRGVHHVIETGEPVLVAEVDDQVLGELSGGSDERFAQLKAMAPRSYMIVPLAARGRTLGAIVFVSTRSGRVYDPEDLALAEELARRAAVAIDNSLLYSERAHVARTLQRSLLPPHLPVIPGVAIGAAFESASGEKEVGGDFYDVFRCGRKRWAIAIGDVCGKGADAAALTGLARFTLRAAAMQRTRPSGILSVLNETVLRSEEAGERFCTAAFVSLDPTRGAARAWLACGGHPLPLVHAADGSVRTVGTPGTALGIVAKPELADVRLELGPGDCLVLFTDGCIELPGDRPGEDLFAELVAATAGLSAPERAQSLVDHVIVAQGDGLRDDVAVVVLELLP